MRIFAAFWITTFYFVAAFYFRNGYAFFGRKAGAVFLFLVQSQQLQASCASENNKGTITCTDPVMHKFYFAVTSQRNGIFPLVTVPDVNVTFDSTVRKIFSTRIQVEFSGNLTFNETLFVEAATQYYNGSTALDGFLEIINVQARSTTNETAAVSYVVAYNYTALRNSVDNDAPIRQLINTASAVKEGLERNSDFNGFFNVSLTPFSVTANSLCIGLNCPQGIHTICEETRIGVEIICKSSCKNNFCLNDGWCVHNHGNTTPVCSCLSSPANWFIGAHCQAYIQLWMPILFAVVVFLILVMIILLACCLPVRTRKPKKVEHPQTKPKEPTPDRSTAFNAPNDIVPSSPTRSQALPIHNNPYADPSTPTDHQSTTFVPSSTEDHDPNYTQIMTHQFESVGPDSNSVSQRQNYPPENQSDRERGSPTSTESTSSGEDMASYMMTVTSCSVSEITQIHQELHNETPQFYKVKKHPVPAKRRYISEELTL